MSLSFFIDSAPKPQNLDSNLKFGIFKQNITLKFLETKHIDPKLTQKQIAQQLGFSDFTTKSYKDKINIPSPVIKKAK